MLCVSSLLPRGSCERISVKHQPSLPVPDGTVARGWSSPSRSSWGMRMALHVCTALLILEIRQTFSSSLWSSGSGFPFKFWAALMFTAIVVSRRQFAVMPQGWHPPPPPPHDPAPAQLSQTRASPRCCKSRQRGHSAMALSTVPQSIRSPNCPMTGIPTISPRFSPFSWTDELFQLVLWLW